MSQNSEDLYGNVNGSGSSAPHAASNGGVFIFGSAITPRNNGDLSCSSACVITGRKCGSLEIVKEFHQLYEEKMREIDEKGGGDCVKAKISLQQDWIRDLTEQNAMLVQTVEELEVEAAERVRLLEEKLNKSAEVLNRFNDENIATNLSGTLQTVEMLRGDVKNALKFISRARDDGVWSTEGLKFHTIAESDLIGDLSNPVRMLSLRGKHSLETVSEKLEKELLENKDLVIRSLRQQLDQVTQYGTIHSVIEKVKSYDSLQKTMIDMRDALTAEVADKHDQIQSLRREVLQLEEQCMQADKQTLFKDDIVRELRKEIKQLRQQQALEQNTQEFHNKLRKLENDNCQLQAALKSSKENYDSEREEMRRKHMEALAEIKSGQNQLMENKIHIEELTEAVEQERENGRRLKQEFSYLKKENNRQQKEKLDSLEEAIKTRASVTTESIQIEVPEKMEKETTIDGGFPSPSGSSDMSNSTSNTPGKSLCCIGKEDSYESKDSEEREEVELATTNLSSQISVMKEMRNRLSDLEHQLQEANDTKQDEIDKERAKRSQEIQNLKDTIRELEKALHAVKARNELVLENYNKTIQHFEESENNAKKEIQQQRLTISNLQQALVTTKQELEELRQKSNQEVELNDLLYISLRYFEEQYYTSNEYLRKLEDNLHLLQDMHLDLEVEKHSLMSDLTILDSRLLKYQNTFRVTELCPSDLRKELIELQKQNAQYESVITYLKEEMHKMSEHLSNLHEILSASNTNSLQENQVLTESLMQVQSVNLELQQRLHEECATNQLQARRIMVLEKAIDEMSVSRVPCSAVDELRKRFDMLAAENAELRATITELQDEIRTFQEEADVSEERSAAYQVGISQCQYILKNLKEKLGLMKHIIKQKTDELSVLQKEHQEQTLMMNALRAEVEDGRKDNDILDLRRTVKELNDKLNRTESALERANEDFRVSQKKLFENTKLHMERQKEAAERERQLLERIHELQTAKDEILRKVASPTSRGDGSEEQRLSAALEEVAALKDELNKLVQLQGKIRIENERLRNQVGGLKNSIAAYQERVNLATDQFEECLCELHETHADRDALEVRNEELTQELLTLRAALKKLNRDNTCKNATMEAALTEAKVARENVCEESRHVVDNVKNWLMEQKKINNQLANHMMEKQGVISRLQMEKQQLVNSLRNMNVPGLTTKKGEEKKGPYWKCSECSQTTSTSVMTSSDSLGSGKGWYVATSEEEVEYPQQMWLDRVECMTEELQKCNDCWKNGLNENDCTVTRDQ